MTGMLRTLAARTWTHPRLRRAVAGAIVAIGAALVLVGALGARWGWLVAGVVIVGLGASLGPARLAGRARVSRRTARGTGDTP